MDLKTGGLYWNGAEPVCGAPLRGDVVCDIAIVGGGVTAAIIADVVLESGRSCVLIDRDAPGAGSTAASTAMVQYEIDTPLLELQDLLGERHAEIAYTECLSALFELEELAARRQIECELELRPSLYLAKTESAARMLEREYQARRAIGIELELLNGPALAAAYRFPALAALRSACALTVNPVKLAAALLNRAAESGLTLYFPAQMKSFSCTASGVVVHTTGGSTITAKRAVFALGYEAARLLPEVPLSLHSTYVVVTSPLQSFSGWEDRCVVWETERPYMYMRSTADDRVMFGGNDHPFRNSWLRDMLLPFEKRRLLRRIRALFSDDRLTADLAWAGTFGESPDGLPFIGEHPDYPAVFWVIAAGGNGMTYSVVARKIIAAWLRGEPSALDPIFGFSRLEAPRRAGGISG